MCQPNCVRTGFEISSVFNSNDVLSNSGTVFPRSIVPRLPPFTAERVSFEYFFVRKFMLIKYSYAFVVMPGGFGTADELFEALTLIQTGKIHNFPVVLIDRQFWAPLSAMLDRMVDDGLIARSDLDLLRITDDLDEAVAHIRDRTVDQFGLAERLRPIRAIGETRVAGPR